MNFREYDAALAKVYELGSRMIGHRSFPKKFFEQTEIHLGNRGLEAGCGTLRWTIGMIKAMRKKGENLEGMLIDAFDASEPMLKKAEKKARRNKILVRLWKADGQDLTYARQFYGQKVNGKTREFYDEEFDWIISSGMLECIPDPIKAARELYRVAKPGATIIIPLVNDNKEGRFASKALKFNIISPEILKEFKETEFKPFEVKYKIRKYLQELTTVYVGIKNS
ncbi:MAG: class I SAM-dependent methyltransferase [Candidatus Woesearchaeota archaeon]